MYEKHIEITRIAQYRIEIHDKEKFNKAMKEYWAQEQKNAIYYDKIIEN